MAWNGRNESILGASSKPISPVVAPTPKQADSATPLPIKTKITTTTTTTTAGAPPPNAWNGRNTKIMEVRDGNSNNNSNKETKVVPTTSMPSNTKGKEPTAISTSSTTPPPVVMMSVISKKSEVVVTTTTPASSSSSCSKDDDDNMKPPPLLHSKEDETTNSTSGSSTTNTTIDEDHHHHHPTRSTALLEGNVVTTTVAVVATTTTAASSSSPLNNSNDVVGTEDLQEKMHSSSITTTSSSSANGKLLPTRSNPSAHTNSNTNTNSRQNHQHQQGRNATTSSEHPTPQHHHHHVRRGNNRGGGSSGGGRGQNNNNHNNASSTSAKNANNNNSNSASSRGNASSGANSRRRAVCSFFLQGQCTRGTSCHFRHDPTAAVPTTNNNNNNNSSSSSTNTTLAETSPSSNDQNQSHPPPAVINNNQFMNAMAASFVPNKRVFDPYKARAIQMAKEAQDAEDRSSFASSSTTTTTAKNTLEEVEGTLGISEEKKTEEEIEDPPFFSIDVECVATGYGSCARGINDGCGNEGRNKEGVPPFQFNDRSHRYPGRVALVDSDGNVLADMVIRPPKDGAGVLSYLTPLTGLTAEICLGKDAISLDEAVRAIKGILPKNGVIVGQAIDHDVEWLGLTAGKDFDRTVDISEIFRQRMPCILNEAGNVIKAKEEGGTAVATTTTAIDGSKEDKSSDKYLGFATRYRHFSLRHVCLNLLGEDIQSGIHDPIVDAKYSLLLFHKYRNSSITQLRIVRDGLHRAPVTPGFAAEKTPVIEGVCVSRAGYPYKRAARKIWRWYSALKNDRQK